jgi:hypothetical protein
MQFIPALEQLSTFSDKILNSELCRLQGEIVSSTYLERFNLKRVWDELEVLRKKILVVGVRQDICGRCWSGNKIWQLFGAVLNDTDILIDNESVDIENYNKIVLRDNTGKNWTIQDLYNITTNNKNEYTSTKVDDKEVVLVMTQKYMGKESSSKLECHKDCNTECGKRCVLTDKNVQVLYLRYKNIDFLNIIDNETGETITSESIQNKVYISTMMKESSEDKVVLYDTDNILMEYNYRDGGITLIIKQYFNLKEEYNWDKQMLHRETGVYTARNEIKQKLKN